MPTEASQPNTSEQPAVDSQGVVLWPGPAVLVIMALLYLLLTEDRTFGLTWLLPILLALAAIAALFAERQHAHRIRRWLVLSANAMVTVSFLDYVFLAFNTNTAFSPTDTLVLSPRAKLCMMLQSSVALVDVAVIVARAVGTFQG